MARAASRDETRPHLTGVLVTASGTELRMVATDSYRLGVKETKLETELSGSLEANVPARTLQELGRIAAAGGAETIGVAALENQVVFTVDDVVLSSRLVEGRFPNYQQLLPESYEHELRVSRDELLEVVRRVGLLAQKNAPLRLRFSEGALDVSAQTPDVGEASESLPVPFSGEPLEIGFNPEFFREGLESAESDELVLKLISPLRPGLIQSGDDGRRLPLPRHADPPQRLGRAVRVTRIELRDFRNYEAAEVELADGLTVVAGPNGAGKTNLLEALYFGCTGARRAPRTSASWCAAARGRRARGARPGRRGRRAPHRGGLRAGRGEAPARGRQPRRQPVGASRRAPARERVPAGAARAREGRAGRTPRASRPGGGRALAGPGRDARRLLARARAAQRARGADPRGRRGPRRARRLGRRAGRATGIRLMADRAEAVDGLRRRSRSSPRRLGLPGAAELRYRPRSRAGDARGSPPSWRERRAADLERGFTAHGPHRDELQLLLGRRRAAGLRLAGPAARRAAGAPVRRARRCWPSAAPARR